MYQNKLLNAVQNCSAIFKNPEIDFILGLTHTQIKKLKKEAIENGFIKESKKEYFLTDEGLMYLKQNPIVSWCDNKYPKRPDINLEYLKLEKMPPIVTKAIRTLERHFLEGEDIKEHSIESYIKKELLSDNASCKNIKDEMEQYILQDVSFNLNDLFNKFLGFGLTKSIISVLLLDVLSKNKDKIAVYEKGIFQLKLNNYMFDRMIYSPANFELKKTIADNLPLLEDISEIVLPIRTNNILDITKGLIYFIRNLDKYTKNTQRLSKKTMRFRNVVMNAKDPINLFYKDIPVVLENKPLNQCDKQLLNSFETVIEELQFASSNLIAEINIFLLNSFAAKSRQELTKRFEDIQEYIGNKELKILLNNILNKESEDKLWVKRIATFINKERIPADWNDDDIADFKIKIKELALKFKVLESAAGDFEILQSNQFDVLLEKIKELNSCEKNILLRKIVNG